MIRPISRDNDANRAKDVTKNLETSKQPMTENNSVQKVSKVEHKNLRDEKKETLIIEKEPPFVPIESWKENSTQVMTNNSHVRHGCQFLLNNLTFPLFISLYPNNLICCAQKSIFLFNSFRNPLFPYFLSTNSLVTRALVCNRLHQ